MKKITKLEIDGMELVVIHQAEDEKILNKSDYNLPYTHHCVSSAVVTRELTAFKRLLHDDKVTGVKTVADIFGGAGFNSAMVRRMFEIKKHLMIDIDDDCCETMEYNFGKENGVTILNGDTYKIVKSIKEKYDFIISEFNRFTFGSTLKGKENFELFPRLFGMSKKYVYILDSAVYGLKRFPSTVLHYEGIFEKKFTSPMDYFRYFNLCVQKAYGFGVPLVIVNAGMIYASMLFIKGYDGETKILKGKSNISKRILVENEYK